MIFSFMKKSKKTIAVLKLFTAVGYLDASNFELLEVLDFCVANVNSDIDYISWNYGAKTWARYKSFVKFARTNKDTVSLCIYYGEQAIISYSNVLLNIVKKIAQHKNGTVELTVYFDNLADSDYYLDFFSGIAEKQKFDYGYVCIVDEKDRRKCDVIVNVEQIDIHTNCLFDVKNGYVRDLYPFNLLNVRQLDSLKLATGSTGKLCNITENLKLWILSNDEINMVKEIICFPHKV